MKIKHYFIMFIASISIFLLGYLIAINDSKITGAEMVKTLKTKDQRVVKSDTNIAIDSKENIVKFMMFKFKKVDSDTSVVINDDTTMVITTYFKAFK